MTMFIIQSLLLMAIAYILGCIIGCILHRLFVEPEKAAVAAAPIAAVAAVAAKAEPKPAPAPKPKPVAKAAPAPKPKAKVAKPKPKPKPAPVTKDDLKRIKGIGPQNEARLNHVDVIAFSQIAAWSAKDQRDMGERLAFPGRIERLIDGVGNALEKKLFALGVYKFDQIAKWTKANETWVGNELGFPGRPERENWVAESKVLAKGGMSEHAKRVERGEITSSRKTKK